MSEGMRNVRQYWEELVSSVKAYEAKKNDPIDGARLRKDVYTSIYRLKERIEREMAKQSLSAEEYRSCEKFVIDAYVKKLMEVRVIGDHVTNDKQSNIDGVALLTSDYGAVCLPAECSAMSVFGSDAFKANQNELEVIIYHHHLFQDLIKRYDKSFSEE